MISIFCLNFFQLIIEYNKEKIRGDLHFFSQMKKSLSNKQNFYRAYEWFLDKNTHIWQTVNAFNNLSIYLNAYGFWILFSMDNKILELCLIYSMCSITDIKIIVIPKDLMSSISPINTL